MRHRGHALSTTHIGCGGHTYYMVPYLLDHPQIPSLRDNPCINIGLVRLVAILKGNCLMGLIKRYVEIICIEEKVA